MATAITLSAAETPFKYDTNRFRAAKSPNGEWRLVEKPTKASPLRAKTATTAASAKWIDSITVAPVGALKTADLDGPSQWGAGFLIGADVNPFVGIQVRALSFEGPGESHSWRKSEEGYSRVTTGEDDWGGRLIDELSILVPAKLNRFSNESFSLSVIPSGNYDLNTDDYGVGVGLGLEKKVTKNLSASVGYEVRGWFHKPTHVDSLLSGQVNWKF